MIIMILTIMIMLIIITIICCGRSSVIIITCQIDHSRNYWYPGYGRDLLTIYLNHQRPQLSSWSGSLNTAHSSGKCWRILSGMLLPLHHVNKLSAICQQGWLLRSGGSVNAFRLIFEKHTLFIFWSLLLNCDNGKGISSYCKLIFTDISRWAKMSSQ